MLSVAGLCSAADQSQRGDVDCTDLQIRCEFCSSTATGVLHGSSLPASAGRGQVCRNPTALHWQHNHLRIKGQIWMLSISVEQAFVYPILWFLHIWFYFSTPLRYQYRKRISMIRKKESDIESKKKKKSPSRPWRKADSFVFLHFAFVTEVFKSTPVLNWPEIQVLPTRLPVSSNSTRINTRRRQLQEASDGEEKDLLSSLVSCCVHLHHLSIRSSSSECLPDGGE